MTTLEQVLTKITKLCEAATEGKWEVEDYRGTEWKTTEGQVHKATDWRSTGLIWSKNRGEYHPGMPICQIDYRKLHADSPPEEIAEFEANAAFIAEARTLLPLLAQVCAVLAQDMNSIKNIAQGKCHNLAEASLAEVAKLIQGAGGAE